MLFYFPSTWRRLAAHFADKVYITILQSPVLFIVISNFFSTDRIRIHWAHLVYLIAISFLYEFLSLWFFSTTLGKTQWNLKLISRDADGDDRRITAEQAFLRVLVSKLNFFFGWTLYALALLTYNRTHFADWVAGTQVVSSVSRTRAPKIRWVLAPLFILFHLPESIRSASKTLSALHSSGNYIEWNSRELKKWIEDVETAIEYEDED